jgi:hypothetical protein
MVKVMLCVEGVDLDDDETVDLLARHADDLLWHAAGDHVTATLLTDSADPVAAAVETARLIEDVVPGARVCRVDDQLVTTSDIATALDMSRETVRLWVTGDRRATTRAFPAPRAVLGAENAARAVKVWAWPDVVVWLREQRIDPEPGIGYLDERDTARLNARLLDDAGVEQPSS